MSHDIVVSVGTDHHPFDRLIDWLDEWAWNNHARTTLVQHGASRPSHVCSSVAFMPSEDLRAAMADAQVVLVQAGPGSIFDARSMCKKPIVVPRVARLHEVVDDHQVAFARHMAARGLVFAAKSKLELHQLLDKGVADPDAFVCEPPQKPTAAGAVSREITALLLARPPRQRRGAASRSRPPDPLSR